MATMVRVMPRGPATGNFKVGKNPQAEMSVPYRVEFSDASANASDAVLAVGAWGTMWGSTMLLGKQARRCAENPCFWDVDEIYSLPEPGNEPAPAAPSNDKWSITIDIGSTPFEVELQMDVEGYQIVNSALDVISGVMVERFDEDWQIGFTTDNPDWTALDAAFGPLGRGTVNSVGGTLTINGTARPVLAGQLRFCGYQEGIQVDVSGVAYARIGLHLKWRQEGWRRMLADKGLRWRNMGTVTMDGLTYVGLQLPIMQKVPDPDNSTRSHDEPVTTPQYLNGHGVPLSEGDEVVMASGQGGTVTGFGVYEEYDLFGLLVDVAT